MYFQLRRDAEQWFKDIASHFPLKLDLYYLCLMAGFAARRKSDVESGTDVLDYFPQDYHSKSLIVATLISTELAAAGIDVSEKDAVNRTISKLVTHDTQSKLTDEGMRLMNRYASGGFEMLMERFEDRPRTIETFLRTYRSVVEKARAELISSSAPSELQ